MSFLAPLFFIGLAAVAVPILVHLIQRERKDVIAFPSLMFLQRIPYQSVERRRIHNWLLLLLRAGAMALVVAAFTRPFFTSSRIQAAVASTGAREVIILLDHSASMGYGDRWARAQAEAKRIVSTLQGEDRGTLVLFARNVEEQVRATSDRAQLEVGIDQASVSADATRYAPALRMAQSKLSQSALPRKEAYLITDFQRTGWERQEDIRLPEGATLSPVSVAELETSDLSISSVNLPRQAFEGQERVTVTVGLTNRGAREVTNVPVTFEVNRRVIDTKRVTIGSNASASVTFPAFTIAEPNMLATVRAGEDQLTANNAFHFVLSPSRAVSVLIVQGEGSAPGCQTLDCPSFFLAAAFQSNRTPPFAFEVLPVARLTPGALEGRALVVLNDVPALPTDFDRALQRFVEQGGGLWLVLKDRTPWSAPDAPLLPGTLGGAVERAIGADGTLGFLDYSHPIFEAFKDVREGNFASVRFLRYRGLRPADTDRVLARFDDGATAMVERRVGAGRVIAFAAPLDNSWTVFPTHPLFLPFVVLTSQYLAQYSEPTAWYTVGRTLDISVPVAAMVREGAAGDTSAARRASGVVLTPSGQQVTLGEGGAASVELDEQGFYAVRLQGTSGTPFGVAVNLDPAESDLSAMSPTEFVASVTGRAAVTASGGSLENPELTPEDIERKQSVWWVLLFVAAAALLTEGVLANRLSRRFGQGLLQVRKSA